MALFQARAFSALVKLPTFVEDWYKSQRMVPELIELAPPEPPATNRLMLMPVRVCVSLKVEVVNWTPGASCLPLDLVKLKTGVVEAPKSPIL